MAILTNIPDAFIFMKVGVHAGETLEDIITRKKQEFDKAGMIFWGYGGGTCHPTKQVQPFARSKLENGSSVYLVMEEIESHHDDKGIIATEYSVDGITYLPIPEGIEVRSSRYALVLGELQPGDLDLDLSASSVAIGDTRGRSGDEYIKGRVDKGCLELNKTPQNRDENCIKKVSLYAEIIDPYAVILRSD